MEGRRVIRASKAGFPCMRSIWYSANGEESIVSPRSQRIFDVGTALEPVIVEWLRQDGWEVKYNPGSQNAEIEVSVDLPDGQFRGHPDCWISKDEKTYLADIKTMNASAFTDWKNNGTEKTKPQYVIQLHIYAKACGAEHMAVVGVNKNTSEMHIDFFDFDPQLWDNITGQAEAIFLSDEPPIENSPQERWCCAYCEYSHKCRYEEDNENATTEDPAFISALQMLAQARELKRQAEDAEKQAKLLIDEKITETGVTDVTGGGYHFALRTVNTSRFDSTAFKKAYPELSDQFTKKIQTARYDLAAI